MTTNVYKEENTRLKTKLFFTENELAKKDKIIDDLVQQQEGAFGVKQKLAMRNSGKNETHLVINLKRKIRDINNEK
jgi:protocatechuate 3,4-dioxygenase beta subunit